MRFDTEPGAGGKHDNARHIYPYVYAVGTAETGDIMYFDGTLWHVLHHGVSGQLLSTLGHGLSPAWTSQLPSIDHYNVETINAFNDYFIFYDWSEDEWRVISHADFNTTIDHGSLAGLSDDDHTQYALRSILTEQGSLVYRNATVWAELLHGTAGQCLLSGGHGANPSWGSPDHGGLAGLSDDDHTQYALRSILTEQGSLVYRNATVWAELLHGAAGQCLLSGGHGANPSWGSPDHGGLAGLGDDDHTQYVLLAGRSGGQTVYGDIASGGNLTLGSTAHATKGKILFGSASCYDEVHDRIGIGTVAPGYDIVVSRSGSTGRFVLEQCTDSTSCGIFTCFKSRGTISSPSATLRGDHLMLIGGSGYTTAWITSLRAYIYFNAAENWTSTNQGTNIAFSTTSIGGVSASERMRIMEGVNVGGTTDPGDNNLSVEGDIYVVDNCSALSFTDRTPQYIGDSLSEICKISQDVDGNIDHSTLPKFIKVERKDHSGCVVTERSLGGSISILFEAIKQLVAWNNQLESKIGGKSVTRFNGR